MNRYFKVEGNIIYPDKTTLTWGPFYYHSIEKTMNKMNNIMEYIVDWVNLKDKSLNIKPEKYVKASGGKTVVFEIKSWKDEQTLQNCDGIISIDEIFFEDESLFS